jgi:hypothetical protein
MAADHVGNIPIAAGGNGFGRKALQLRRQGYLVHCGIIGRPEPFGKANPYE